jgi:DNA repair protein RecO (recombination protein O)
LSLYKTEAVVLASWDLGEADKIMAFLTKEYGKIRGVAKGARRQKSKFGASLEPMTLGELVYFKKERQDLAKINSFDITNPNLKLKDDFELFAATSYLAEFLNIALEEESPAPEIFALLLATNSFLAQGGSIPSLLRIFEIKLLKVLGYEPEMKQCLFCRQPPAGELTYFSWADGGIVCEGCKGRAKSFRRISPPALGFWRRGLEIRLEQMNRLTVSAYFKRELEELLENFIRYIYPRNFRSRELLKIEAKDI